MREIKNRLRVDNKIVGYEKWYEGNRNEITSAEPCWLYSKDGQYWNPTYIYHRHKDQFTGLKDKNGKEIYEGDIFRFNTQTRRGLTRLVEYEGSAWMPFNDGEFIQDEMGDWFEFVDNPFEVIGNIYEHKELLNGK